MIFLHASLRGPLRPPTAKEERFFGIFLNSKNDMRKILIEKSDCEFTRALQARETFATVCIICSALQFYIPTEYELYSLYWK